jgi:UDP-N-acetylglucosamine:LPS N-acetylglucosamine transferase
MALLRPLLKSEALQHRMREAATKLATPNARKTILEKLLQATNQN